MIKRKVIIADSDQKLVIAIKDTLKARGYNTISSVDGVKALEQILIELPDVLIIGIDLPLIDGERLSAIIRSNPKTANIPIIFISNTEKRIESYQPFKDVFLVRPITIEKIVEKVVSFYEKIEKIARVSGTDTEIEGNISQIPLVDLIQILSMNKKTGAIVMNKSELKGFVYLQNGNIINANLGKIEGEKAFFRLLAWKEGKFEFIPTKVLTLVRINRPIDILIMEGMRQLDEWEKMKDSFPGVDSILKLKVSPKDIKNDLTAITQEIVFLLEFYQVIGDIVDNCSYPDYEVYQAINTLIKEGVVHIVKQESKPRRTIRKTLLLPDQIFKIRDIITLGRKTGLGIERGKILIISPGWKTLKKFINTCRDITGFTLSREFLSKTPRDGNPIGYVGTLTLSESVEVNFFVVPPGEEFKPIWHTFLRGMLGVLFLYDGGEQNVVKSLKEANLYFNEKVCSPTVFVLFSSKKPTQQQFMNVQEEFSIKKEDTLFIISPQDVKGSFMPLNRLLGLVVQ
ncbi:MAG TPA: DUF4388 domain-containing protein [bacterium]